MMRWRQCSSIRGDRRSQDSRRNGVFSLGYLGSYYARLIQVVVCYLSALSPYDVAGACNSVSRIDVQSFLAAQPTPAILAASNPLPRAALQEATVASTHYSLSRRHVS